MEGLDIRSLDSIAEVYSEVSEYLMDIIAMNAWKYGITEEERSDVLELSCEKVFRSRHTFRPGRNTGGWLYRVVLTTILDYLDKKNRRSGKCVALEDYSELLRRCGSDYIDNAEDEMISKERQEYRNMISTRALEILQTFTQQDQDIFFRTLDGEKSADIAESLGMTAVNVRQRLMKIKARLKSVLTDEFGPFRRENVLYSLPSDVLSGMEYRRSGAGVPESRMDFGADLLGELQSFLTCCYDFAVLKTQESMSGDILKESLREEFGRILPVKVRSYSYSDGREVVKMSVGLKEGNAVLDVSNAEMNSLMSFVGNIGSYIEDAETLFDQSLRKSLWEMCK
jgi:RNA polymerase sigma factor (sigma-70 family)